MREDLQSMAGLQRSTGPRLRPATVSSGAEEPEGHKGARAACSSLDAALFYGEHVDLREEPKAEKEVREDIALSVCEGCAVRWTCLLWALQHEEEFGVWGGMTAPERKDFLKYLTRRKKKVTNATELKEAALWWINRRRSGRRS
jgi:hypothetical protein